MDDFFDFRKRRLGERFNDGLRREIFDFDFLPSELVDANLKFNKQFPNEMFINVFTVVVQSVVMTLYFSFVDLVLIVMNSNVHEAIQSIRSMIEYPVLEKEIPIDWM